MWMFMDMGEYKESELRVKQQDTWMGTPVSASTRHVTCQVNWVFFFFSPSNKELSKTSPSEQEHIHCKQGKRTNSGDLTYVMIFNASKGWNAFTPECCFKFDLLLLCSSCHPPVFNIIPPVGHGKTL